MAKTLSPPEKVEVAVEVAVIVPNCPLPPSMKEPEKPSDEETPPANVDVAVEVDVMEPVVRRPVVMFEKILDTERKMFVNKEVDVAFVMERLVKVEVAVEVAVIEPTPR